MQIDRPARMNSLWIAKSMLLNLLVTCPDFLVPVSLDFSIQTPMYCFMLSSLDACLNLPGSLSHFFLDLHEIWCTVAVRSFVKSHQAKYTTQIKGRKKSAQLHEISLHWFPRYSSTIVCCCIMLLQLGFLLNTGRVYACRKPTETCVFSHLETILFFYQNFVWWPCNENFQLSLWKVRQSISCFGIMGPTSSLFLILKCLLFLSEFRVWTKHFEPAWINTSATNWVKDSQILVYCFQGLMGGCTHCHFTLSPAWSYLALSWT
jgi:hypothetical protein